MNVIYQFTLESTLKRNLSYNYVPLFLWIYIIGLLLIKLSNKMKRLKLNDFSWNSIIILNSVGIYR